MHNIECLALQKTHYLEMQLLNYFLNYDKYENNSWFSNYSSFEAVVSISYILRYLQ